jgi:GTPase SAR1 family protein
MYRLGVERAMTNMETNETLTPQIGIWGPTEAGKTTYLAGLKLAIDLFQPRMKLWAVDTPAKQFIEVNSARIAQGIFPRSTDYKVPERYTFRIYQERSTFLNLKQVTEYHELSLLDASGHLILDPDDPKGYFTTLQGSAGILVMIDPTKSGSLQPGKESESYFSVLHRLIHRLAETRLTASGKLDTHLAICITKSDLDPHWEHRDDPAEHLEHLLGKPTYRGLMNYCESARVFSISVVGRYRTSSGLLLPNVAEEPDGARRIADLDQWQPLNVLDPLFWLFDQIDNDLARGLSPLQRTVRRMGKQPNYREGE